MTLISHRLSVSYVSLPDLIDMFCPVSIFLTIIMLVKCKGAKGIVIKTAHSATDNKLYLADRHRLFS